MHLQNEERMYEEDWLASNIIILWDNNLANISGMERTKIEEDNCELRCTNLTENEGNSTP